MRILLVTFSDLLPVTLERVLNLQNEFCAILVDEPQTAKNFLKKTGGNVNLIHPFYELPECISDFYYDLVLCISDSRLKFDFYKIFMRAELPKDKFIQVCLSDENFLLRRSLEYYEKYATEFEIFATGISYTSVALDVNQFNYKLFNFAFGAQDLYYDYQIAKRVLTPQNGGGRRKIRYALIGLAPYSFHYNISKSYASVWRLLKYFIALKDLHNFWLYPEQYQKLFRNEYLSTQLNFDNFDINNVNLEKISLRFIDFETRINARGSIDSWKNRFYPDTLKENIEILDNYLYLCTNNKVKPIMFLPPMTEGFMKYFSKKKLDEFLYLVSEAQKNFPDSVFFDGWKIKGFDDSDFYDVDHLNIKGAAKFSAILNGVIEQIEKS